jgi:hypothetical protein
MRIRAPVLVLHRNNLQKIGIDGQVPGGSLLESHADLIHVETAEREIGRRLEDPFFLLILCPSLKKRKVEESDIHGHLALRAISTIPRKAKT